MKNELVKKLDGRSSAEMFHYNFVVKPDHIYSLNASLYTGNWRDISKKIKMVLKPLPGESTSTFIVDLKGTTNKKFKFVISLVADYEGNRHQSDIVLTLIPPHPDAC